MDTINNIAGAAKEPVSGERGAGTADDPYDKGNSENSNGSAAPKDVNQPPTNGVDSSTNRDGPSNATTDSSAGDPKSGQNLSQKQQGADRPNDSPGPEDTEAIKDKKESAETSQKKDDKPKVPHTDEEREEAMKSGNFPHDPDDHSGEPLKLHDGSEKKKERSESVSHEGGGALGEPPKGQGTKYVKSSGMDADGGDFDATKPGAGTEATRLLEEKGIKKSSDKASDSSDAVSPSPSEKAGTKPSKLAKLKEKLHIKKKESEA